MGMSAVAVWRHMKPPPRVQPDALPGLPALRALARPRAGPVVTLYAPLLRTLPGGRGKAAAYKAAVTQAAAELTATGVSAASRSASPGSSPPSRRTCAVSSIPPPVWPSSTTAPSCRSTRFPARRRGA